MDRERVGETGGHPMKTQVINYKQALRNTLSLEAKKNINFPEIKSSYEKLINDKETVLLSDIVKAKHVKQIAKGDLVIQNKYFSDLKAYIAQENQKKQAVVFSLKNSKFTKAYLLWFFSRKQVIDYLGLFKLGDVISYIPLSAILDLQVPYPNKKSYVSQEVIIRSSNRYRNVIHDYFYKEYLVNVKQKNFISSFVLAGAICEAILSYLLLEHDVKKGHIKGKTLGALISFVEIENFLDKEIILKFKLISQSRNHIHANKLLNNPNLKELYSTTNKNLDKIIEEFGI